MNSAPSIDPLPRRSLGEGGSFRHPQSSILARSGPCHAVALREGGPVAPKPLVGGFTLPKPRARRAFTLPEQRGRHAFTLIELLVVMGIIALAFGFLIPTLGPASGRSLDAATGQFRADLEAARLIAIAERTRTRVLIPTNSNNFAVATSSPTPWPTNIALRGYLVVSEKRTESVWKQRGKWSQLPEGIAFDSTAGVFTQPAPTPVPTPPGISIDVGGSGTVSYVFNGPYIEFLANGSSNLNPSATPAPAAVVADGFIDSTGTFVKKNIKLRFTVTVDPLTGSVSVK